MSHTVEGRHFLYHAQVLGLGGRIDKPSCETIPSQCSVALSEAGGEGYAQVRDFNWKQIIRFDEATAYVSGSWEDDPENPGRRLYNTLATVTLRNLNIANMLLAEQVVTRISSRHREGEAEGEINFNGSLVEGLRIAGVPYHVTLDCDLFARYPTYQRFRQMEERDRFAMCRRTAGWNEEEVERGVPERNGSVVTSAVHTIEPESPYCGVTRNGNIIQVEQFGTIRIANVLMKPGQRRLTMFMVDLGCPVSGPISSGGGEGNGTPIIP
jgi:hypothetical protein